MSWYQTFFHGLPQQAWQAAQTDEQNQLDLEMIVETLSFGPDDRVLDVFCGYGRHTLPLARMGAQMTAVDISEEYITALNAAAKTENLNIRAIQADFITTPALTGDAESFDAAFCLGNSFCFFPYPDMLTFLQRIADLLRPGGRLLVHSSMVAEVVLPDFQERNWMPVGHDMTVLVENQYEPLQGCIHQQLTYLKNNTDGSVESAQRTAAYYVYTLAELTRLMAQVGLAVESVYGTIHLDPFMVGDEGAWIVAEKA